MSNSTVIILAAGEGKRMKTKTAKVLNKVCFKPMIDYVVKAAEEISTEKPVVVIGHKAEEIKEHLGDRVNYALQSEQMGTGHAVTTAMDFIENSEGDTVVVLNGDMPQITGDTLRQVVAHHETEGFGVTVVGAFFDDPTGYGRLVTESGRLLKIVEHKDCNENELEIKEVNAGIYLFNKKELISALPKLKNNNSQNEYYLTDAIEIIGNAGAFIVEDKNEVAGCNTKVELAEADRNMRLKINKRLLEKGAVIINPECTYIEDSVEIGLDSVIYPNCIIKGKTVIGEDCEVSEGSHIEDSIICDGVSVKTSTLLECEIGKGTTVGPYAYIRPRTKVGERCRIGDFVELKKSVIGNGTKVSHLTYLGDAIVGERVNFGCGTVAVNYDGVNKFQTKIGNDAFIGCNANLVAPVTIGDNSFIAAGSTITDEVPDDAFAIARQRQTTKLEWKKPKDRK